MSDLQRHSYADEDHWTLFDYNSLDDETKEFLQTKAANIYTAAGRLYTAIGQELDEAQERLASHHEGVFEKWYTSLGFKKRTVYNLIRRYRFVVQNLHNRKMLEELPLSLTYEISKPSAPEELQKAVLEGDIKTHKEYKEMEARLKESESRIEILQGALEAELKKPAQEPKVIEVPKVPPEMQKRLIEQEQELIRLKTEAHDQAQTLDRLTKEKEIYERRAKLNESEAKEYEKLKSQIRHLSLEKDDLTRQIESATALSAMVVDVKHLLDKIAPAKYSRAIERLDSDVVIRNITEMVEMVESWCRDMRAILAHDDYIDAEVIM